jgi:hypothetical protein
MSDLSQLRSECRRLAGQLEGEPHWEKLRAIYLELAPLMGELQGALSRWTRAHGDEEDAQPLQTTFDELKASVRQVGLDIRLASEGALAMGLRVSLERAEELLDRLEQAEQQG